MPCRSASAHAVAIRSMSALIPGKLAAAAAQRGCDPVAQPRGHRSGGEHGPGERAVRIGAGEGRRRVAAGAQLVGDARDGGGQLLRGRRQVARGATTRLSSSNHERRQRASERTAHPGERGATETAEENGAEQARPPGAPGP